MALLKARVATNPFAVVALAQLAAHRRSSDPERKASKREIIWLLYDSGYGRDEVLALLRFIDWMLRLPPALERELRGELIALEEQKKSPTPPCEPAARPRSPHRAIAPPAAPA